MIPQIIMIALLLVITWSDWYNVRHRKMKKETLYYGLAVKVVFVLILWWGGFF